MANSANEKSQAVSDDSLRQESLRKYRERMFGDGGRCECNNRGKCVRGNACYYKKAKAALDRAHDIRKFEIELLWKRAAYVATFQTLLFAALGLSFRAENNVGLVFSFQVATCVAGVFSSFFWRLINKGSKFWHENWTYHIDFLEDEFEGKLHKTVLYSGDKYRTKEKSLNAKTQPYSVSRVNIAISNLFCVAWSVLLVAFLWKLFEPGYSIAIPNFLSKGWPALLFWSGVLIAILFCCHHKLRSKFDDMNPKKDVRWIKRVLPKVIRKRQERKSND